MMGLYGLCKYKLVSAFVSAIPTIIANPAAVVPILVSILGYNLLLLTLYFFSCYYNVWFHGGYHYLETIDIRDH